MQISIQNLGKKYNHKWIFRNLSAELMSADHIGILGKNGSGKSTLLKVLSGMVQAGEGSIEYRYRNINLQDDLFLHLAAASPHLELFMEFTLSESIELHRRFKPFIEGCDLDFILRYTGLGKNKDKQLSYFSSGMLQRVKLALAVFSDVPMVLLDEPCSNLDAESVLWYQNLINTYMPNRLLIVASNNADQECHTCQRFFEFTDHAGLLQRP